MQSLRTNISWTLIGNAGYAACQWLVLGVIAKFGSMDLVGNFALAFAITAPIFLFSGLELRAVQATDAVHRFSFCDYLLTRSLTTCAALATTSVVIFMWSASAGSAALTGLVAAGKAAESISDVYHGAAQRAERLDVAAKSLLLRGTLNVLAVGAGMMVTRDPVAIAASLFTSSVAVLIAYDLRVHRRVIPHMHPSERLSKPTISHRLMRSHRLVAACFPLGVVMMMTSLTTSIPRYYLQGHLGTAILGVFAAIEYLPMAAGLAINALGQSLMPRLSAHYHKGEAVQLRSLLQKAVLWVAVVSLFVVTTVWLLGGVLLTTMYSSAYRPFSSLFLLLTVAATLKYVGSILGYALTATGRFASQVPLNAVMLFVVWLAAMILIPRFGLIGAALSVLAGAAVQLPYKVALVAFGLRRASLWEDEAQHG